MAVQANGRMAARHVGLVLYRDTTVMISTKITVEGGCSLKSLVKLVINSVAFARCPEGDGPSNTSPYIEDITTKTLAPRHWRLTRIPGLDTPQPRWQAIGLK